MWRDLSRSDVAGFKVVCLKVNRRDGFMMRANGLFASVKDDTRGQQNIPEGDEILPKVLKGGRPPGNDKIISSVTEYIREQLNTLRGNALLLENKIIFPRPMKYPQGQRNIPERKWYISKGNGQRNISEGDVVSLKAIEHPKGQLNTFWGQKNILKANVVPPRALQGLITEDKRIFLKAKEYPQG